MIFVAYLLTLLSYPFVGEWDLLCITLYNLMLFINEHCICLTLDKKKLKPSKQTHIQSNLLLVEVQVEAFASKFKIKACSSYNLNFL